MAIAYDWTCSACGAANRAGIDACSRCGGNAITSAAEIERRKAPQSASPLEPQTSPLRQPYKFIAACGFIAAIAGFALERFTFPPSTVWYAGISLIVGGGIVVVAMLAVQKRRSQHDT
jgi:hypothetical protein